MFTPTVCDILADDWDIVIIRKTSTGLYKQVSFFVRKTK